MRNLTAAFLFINLVLSFSLGAESSENGQERTPLTMQGKLREERTIQVHAGVYPKLTSFGAVYNFNKYLSLGAFYHKDNNLQMDMLYSTKAWVVNSVYFQGGDTYVYGASRAKLDWSGPQLYLNPRLFPFPDIPVYISVNAGRDIYGDSGKHNLLLSYNISRMQWVISPPVYMEQQGSPYWFAAAGLGTVIHLPYGFFIDAQYTDGKYFGYNRNLHARPDERIFWTQGMVLQDGTVSAQTSAGSMSPEEFAATWMLMNARHRERGHGGRHVIYDITVGYSFGL